MTTQSEPSPDEAPTEELKPEPETGSKTGGAIVKRRWSVFTRAGSGAVILAATGAIALGSAGDQAGAGATDETSGETQERVIES